MRVWFDHQIFGVQRFGGYTRYFLSLARALGLSGRCEPSIVAPAHLSRMLTPADPLHWSSWRLDAAAWTSRFRPQVVAPWFRLLSAVEKPSLVHETHHLLGASHVAAGIKIVSTCHDLIPERLADGSESMRRQIELRRLSFERSQLVICVSESTRNDFDHHYPSLSKRAAVVHHGVEVASPTATAAGADLPAAYLLYVGPRSGYKNFSLLVQAFARLRSRGELVLLCFGAGAPTAAEKQHWVTSGMREEQLQHTAGDDTWLARCYASALCLVYPSTMEGFGMPLTEAMALGCPVVCSDIPVFREVCAEAAVYFNPQQADSLAEQLTGLLEHSEKRQGLRAAGTLRAARYSWQRCANETLNCYETCFQA